MLLGHSTPEGWQVEAAIPAGNTRTDSAHNRYQIAPLELVKIERDARRQGLDIAGFYHSHPDHPAQWSPTDFAEAHSIVGSYVVTTVEKGAAHGKPIPSCLPDPPKTTKPFTACYFSQPGQAAEAERQ